MDEKELEGVIDQSFNDDELKDIMEEIESLEQEFGEAEVSPEPVQMSTDESVSEEMPVQMNSQEEVIEVEVEAPVTEIKPAMKESWSAEHSPMSFAGSGKMDFNLDFQIGEHTAKLMVEGESGLVVEMAGVHIRIDHNEGCVVEMQGGVRFNVPLSSEKDSFKKAS